MSVNYVSDNAGHTIAVQIPIEEQSELLDKRLQAITDNPKRLRPVEELF